MKKLMLAGALALFGATTMNAQTEKGNWLVGSDVMGMRFTNGLNVQLSPKGAYFIQDKWAVGANVSLGIYKANGSSTTQTNWGITPFTRYYFNDAEVKGGTFFGEGSLGFGGVNSGSGSTTNGVTLGVGAGYAYFITKNISLEGLLKFSTITGGGNTTGNGNLDLGVGFSIFLPTSTLK